LGAFTVVSVVLFHGHWLHYFGLSALGPGRKYGAMEKGSGRMEGNFILGWWSIVVCSAAVGFTLAEASYFIIYICTYALRNTFKIRISFLSHFFASSGLLHYVRLINF